MRGPGLIVLAHGPLLMTILCIACLFAAIGLWRGLSWGYWLAVGMLALNAIGDLINVISGTEPKAIVGIPIALMVLAYLRRKQTKNYFRQRDHDFEL
jgi:uncharacterized membrane protein (DUF2068 family)